MKKSIADDDTRAKLMQERVLRTEKSGMSPGFDPRRRQIFASNFQFSKLSKVFRLISIVQMMSFSKLNRIKGKSLKIIQK